ncbi:unnamed protein product [Parnassius apollo]|uniref:(apollo) hypothetical protein n=1 Tax=Parnassius apollo TaxID=110799 RepID=A0A8S3WM05_PARAO|nr:unnamed protein product [Parnassius apollo]
MQKLTERIDDLKQRIAAWGKRIRRYTERSTRFNQNRLFQSDQKRLYKSLERPIVSGTGPAPNQADMVAFWRSLWSEPVNHNEGPWTEVVASQYASITPMDPVIITPDDVAEAVRRAPNWKSPGLDGLHHYWLKGFMVCHSVLARQFQEALNQKSLPSLFTTGITHLVPKDQGATDPSKYRPITYTVHGIKVNDRNDHELLFKLVDSLNIDIWDHGAPALRDAMIDAYLERIASQYPDIVTLVNSGPSFEGRDIKYLKISTTNFTDASKPIYFMNAMLHAREWVTAPVTLYSIHRLVEDVRSQDRDLLENIDWIVMPLANPDGYEYSHTDERLWRRTRSFNPSVSTTCYGVDANRNFNVSHNTLGVSSDPCSNVYPGHVPFSEVETGYIRDILLEYVDRIQLYLDIHSHGNYILFGYGDTSLPPNVLHLHHVGAVMGSAIDALKLPEERYYLVGNSALVLYVSSGSAQDYGQLVGVPFSYTLELPGYGQAFTVPPQYIEQINEETWHGIAASARASLIHYKARFNN